MTDTVVRPDNGPSLIDQAQSAVGQKTDQLAAQVQQVGGDVQDRVRNEITTRSTQAGEQVASMSDALRTTGDQLRTQGKEQPAHVLEQMAYQSERLGQYLRNSDADRILADVEEFGRRQPWVIAATGLVIGLAASRFLKASSGRRYQTRRGPAGNSPSLRGGPSTPPPLTNPAARSRPGGTARGSGDVDYATGTR